MIKQGFTVYCIPLLFILRFDLHQRSSEVVQEKHIRIILNIYRKQN